MNNESETRSAPAASLADDLSPAEMHLGKVLTLIHRVLPKLEEQGRSLEVDNLLGKAAIYLESARQAHKDAGTKRGGVAAPVQKVATGVEPEIAAIIAAAVAVLFDRPYRLVSVQPVATPGANLNVWALEGRTQIFQSHRIRGGTR